MNSKVIQGYLFLLLASLIWGGAFIYQKRAAESLDAFSFNTIRFSVGFLMLLPLLLLPSNLFEQKNSEKSYSPYFAGCIAGIFMFSGISLQQAGLEWTTAGKAGFLTSLYIIFVPAFAFLFIKQRIGAGVWIGGGLAVIGFGVLSFAEENQNLKLNFGDFLMFISALFWAGHVLWLSIVARYSNVLKVVIFQMFAVAILSAIAMFIFSDLGSRSLIGFSNILDLKQEIIYTGIISTSIAFMLQILGQRSVSASNAAIIMSLEGVFAVIAGVLFLGEVISLSFLIGCCFIFTGIILAQLKP